MLTEKQREDNRSLFCEYINRIIPSANKRARDFILERSDFLTAPASCNKHDAEEGGLVNHSLNVLYWMIRYIPYSGDASLKDAGIFFSFASMSLLHDICKVNYYKKETKTDGTVCYEVKDLYPFGHGEKSCDIISNIGIEMNPKERLAIRWHMGAYGLDSYNLSLYNNAVKASPFVFPLHLADMMAVLHGRPDDVQLKKFLEAIPV